MVRVRRVSAFGRPLGPADRAVGVALAPGRRILAAGAHRVGAVRSTAWDPAPLAERLAALSAHVRGHFRVEEAFLASTGYPGLEEHQREHALQLAEFAELQRGLEQGPETAGVLDAGALGEIKRWFFSHVIGEDRRFAEDYHAVVGARSPRPYWHGLA